MGVKEKGKNGALCRSLQGSEAGQLRAQARRERRHGGQAGGCRQQGRARHARLDPVNLSLSPCGQSVQGQPPHLQRQGGLSSSASKKLKDDTFHKKDGGVYRGPAVACRMVYSTLAGLSPKTEAKYRKNPPVFNAWFAPVQSGSLDRPIHVLVGVTGKIKGKDFVAYANRATLNGKPLNAQSMAKR
jgi:hypothetical protein